VGSEGVTLTIEPGVTVKFDGYYYIQVDGSLAAIGTVDRRILFTSNQTDPAIGDWKYIRLSDTNDDETTRLEYTTIEFADGDTPSESRDGSLWIEATIPDQLHTTSYATPIAAYSSMVLAVLGSRVISSKTSPSMV